MRFSSASRSGEGRCTLSIKALVSSEYSGRRPSNWFHIPVLGNGVGSISGITSRRK